MKRRVWRVEPSKRGDDWRLKRPSGPSLWCMMDALRESDPDYRSDIVARGRALAALADLLESLLPPREP